MVKPTRAVFTVLAITLAVAACSRSDNAPTAKSPPPDQTPLVAAGEKLFEQYCAGCHKHRGRGNYIERIPATLLTRRSKQELMDWIRGSDKHREMPNFRMLSDEEREQLAAYLKAQIHK